MFAGLLLVIVGVVFLLENLGYISGNVWDVIWPLIVIIAGLSLLLRQGSIKGIVSKIRKK